jgi:hypothetical protein
LTGAHPPDLEPNTGLAETSFWARLIWPSVEVILKNDLGVGGEHMSGSGAGLYEEDFVRWSEQQSSALRDAARVGTNLPLDWENLAEEVESLGRSQRHELRSRIAVILEHLLKLEYSPATDPRRGWMETIARERLDAERLLEDSPSLRGEIARMISQEGPRVARLTTRVLLGQGEGVGTLAAPTYVEDQVLGDWFPEDPSTPPP